MFYKCCSGSLWSILIILDCANSDSQSGLTSLFYSRVKPLLTLLALQGYSGLQVVHLHLQALESEVTLTGFALVGNEDNDDEDDEEAACPSNADDSGAAEGAVRGDVDYTWRELDATYTGLKWSTFCEDLNKTNTL